ncbi:SxtJ family membrane protein [Glaciecola sp. MF2-115]|uniref:SxtJ family membrane protein n=1 Tax=Glaciecola sp. MF2-115 TaxID=3384827 RepID=UPI0039A106B6
MLNSIRKLMLPTASSHDTKAMRSFAISMAIFLPLVFMLVLPWIFNKPMPYWPLVISSTLMVLYFVYPRGIYNPYYLWMIIASILGWLNTRIILALVFYIVITPIGLVMKLLGKLQYKKQLKESSTWVIQDHNDDRKDKKRLEEPF